MPRYEVSYKEIRDVRTILIADNKEQIERTLKDCTNTFDIQIKEKN